jgi:hypothetical protein
VSTSRLWRACCPTSGSDGASAATTPIGSWPFTFKLTYRAASDAGCFDFLKRAPLTGECALSEATYRPACDRRFGLDGQRGNRHRRARHRRYGARLCRRAVGLSAPTAIAIWLCHAYLGIALK